MTLMRYEIDSPVGVVAVLSEDNHLHRVDFADRAPCVQAQERKIPGAAQAIPGSNQDEVARRFTDYFAGDVAALDSLDVTPAGTDFEKTVWLALRAIPAGETWSYGQMARHVGRPGASRAVGRANGLNPISLVLPCHRVIGADGTLTGYGGGLDRKRWLLQHEGARLL